MSFFPDWSSFFVKNCHRGLRRRLQAFRQENELPADPPPPWQPESLSFDSSLRIDSFSYIHFLSPQIQFADAEQSYRSDCETDDGISAANYNEYLNGAQQQPTSRRKNRSPLTMRQGPQMSSDINNRRLQQYNSSQERLRNGESEGSLVTQFVESWIGALFRKSKSHRRRRRKLLPHEN